MGESFNLTSIVTQLTTFLFFYLLISAILLEGGFNKEVSFPLIVCLGKSSIFN